MRYLSARAAQRSIARRIHPTLPAQSATQALLQRLRLAFLLVGLIIIYGTMGYHLIEKMEWLDSLYMTVITISTVGFTEVHPLDEPGRLFTITLILGGVGTLYYTLSAAAEMVVSEQFSHWRQHQKMQNAIDQMQEHTIICGWGRIGKQVVTDLRDHGVPFVVIDNQRERCAALLERGVHHIEGDATLDETLLEAGIARASGLVAALNTDADNVMTVVSARGLNPKLHIIARAALPQAEKKLSRAGANEVISPYVVGGRRISLAMLRPAVSKFLNAVLYDEELQAEITELVIDPNSPMAGQTLVEAGMAHGQDVLPLALLRDGKFLLSPLPDTVLQPHDALIIVMPVDELRVERRG